MIRDRNPSHQFSRPATLTFDLLDPFGTVTANEEGKFVGFNHPHPRAGTPGGHLIEIILLLSGVCS